MSERTKVDRLYERIRGLLLFMGACVADHFGAHVGATFMAVLSAICFLRSTGDE